MTRKLLSKILPPKVRAEPHSAFLHAMGLTFGVIALGMVAIPLGMGALAVSCFVMDYSFTD